MKKRTAASHMVVFLIVLTVTSAHSWDGSTPLVINHNHTDLSQIPDEWIDVVQANRRLHYVHASHGKQLTVGLLRIEDSDVKYSVAIGSQYLPTEAGAFCMYDREGDPEHYWYGDEWITGTDITRQTLNGNPTINVSMFCWCMQMEIEDEAYVEAYFDSMSVLETEFPNVTFVYMTGNAQVAGTDGYNRYLRNEQIREYCVSNSKVLFDFADLDSWWFNSSSQQWEQNTYRIEGHDVPLQHPHFEGDDAGHTTYESCGQKGRAVWWMMAELAGWQTTGPNCDFLRGDANGDMLETAADAIYILTYIYRGGLCACRDACDANDDGHVTVADAICVVSYVYRSGSPPPHPFPNCGVDTTEDDLNCNFHFCAEMEYDSTH